MAHTDVVSLQDDGDVDVDVVDAFSKSEQAQGPVHTQKLVQPP